MLHYDMSYPQYSVKDVAELTGISAYAIRYFDRIGIVVPKRDEHGQRMYSYYDILNLTRRNHYKKLGFSLQETEQVFSGPPSGELLSMLEQKQQELQQQKLFLEMAEHELEQLSGQLKRLRRSLNRVMYMERPACWHVPHSRDGIICQDKASCQARSIAGNFKYTFSFSYGAESEEDDCSDWDITVDAPYAGKIGFDKIPASFYVPEETCLYTVIGVPGTDFLKRGDLRVLYDYAKENSLIQGGVIYGRDIINRMENGLLIRYYEVWMPVQEL